MQDKLNTHAPAALYQRFEFHYTPIHASWLNMAEIELSVIGRQCLHRRIDTLDKLASAAQARAKDRNARKQGVTWCFTTKDARRKLERLYAKN